MVNHNFIPGIEKFNKAISHMNQAVLDYRMANSPKDIIPFKRIIRDADEHPKLTHKYPLKNFQRDGIVTAMEILQEHQGCIIADDMGLGKTIEAIVLAENIKANNILIVVPANVIKQWQVQWYKWTGNMPQHIKTKVQAASIQGGPIFVCSYEILDSLVNSENNRSRYWDLVIYDEIHKLRSRSTKMSLAARELREHAKFVVGLTGSLQWGYTRDLWNPLRCVFKYKFGTADEFDFTYCGAYYNEHGGKVNKGNTSSDGINRSDELAIRLSYVSIARTRREVAAELPAFERKIIRIPPTKKATLALHSFLRKELPYMNAIMSTTSEKTGYVLEFLEGIPNAIVFTWTKSDVGLLSALIAQTGKKVYTITGATSKAERQQIITDAAKEQATIVATIDSTGVGVDGLQFVSSNVVYHSLSHSPKLLLQAEARLMRIGQQNPVTATYIVMQDSADELVISILSAKTTQDRSSGGEDGNIMSASLKMDDTAMQNVLDEWVKNATDEIDNVTSNSEGWTDEDDEHD